MIIDSDSNHYRNERGLPVQLFLWLFIGAVKYNPTALKHSPITGYNGLSNTCHIIIDYSRIGSFSVDTQNPPKPTEQLNYIIIRDISIAGGCITDHEFALLLWNIGRRIYL